ncbi:MAG: NAD(P)-dependent oxidoreductase [Micromonosporaceae bacterium]
MRVLVTGARGKVGRAAVAALAAGGHEVTATDLHDPDWDPPRPDRTPYVKADLTDAGQVYALIGGASVGEGPRPGPFEAVVHAGALPAPGRHAPHVVFGNNLMATFNVVEACVRLGVRRLVNISSESVPGFLFAERPFLPEYLPVDEDHPVRPQDPYALAKLFGEQLCDAAVARSDLRCVSLRPTWVQDSGSYARHLGPLLRDRSAPSITGWAYVDADDLAEAIRLAVECDLPGHEVFYVANPDTVGGRPLHESWRAAYPDAATELRPVDRPDASGVSTRKIERVLGWRARRSWRDYLTVDGEPLTGDGEPR